MTDINQLNDALAGNYLLVEVEIRSWSGRRTDRSASDEVIATKGATHDSGRFVKNLFAGAAEELGDVQKRAALIRQFVYSNTLPWASNSEGARRGARLLPATKSIEFLKDLNAVKQIYDASVSRLVGVWDVRVESAMKNLGTMADGNDYPKSDQVAQLFGVSVTLNPVPSQNDFTRINVPAALAEALGNRHAQAAQSHMENALADLKERLLKELQRMGTQLNKAGNGEKTRLYDSLITNLKALVDLTRTMNVTDKPEINALADRIEQELLIFPVDVYRNDPARAAEVAGLAKTLAVDAALEEMWKL